MSSRELIESLRRAGDERVRLLRQEAEQELESLRASLTSRVEELRKRYDSELAAAAGEEERRVLAEAGNQARSLRLAAEKILADRLLSIARSSLQQLRDNGYPAVFEKLALEAPPLPWKRVRVNSADVGLARTYFPEAEIVPVQTIAGGLDAETADGKIRINNTFEKRLERAWGELLPGLARDVYREASDVAA